MGAAAEEEWKRAPLPQPPLPVSGRSGDGWRLRQLRAGAAGGGEIAPEIGREGRWLGGTERCGERFAGRGRPGCGEICGPGPARGGGRRRQPRRS